LISKALPVVGKPKLIEILSQYGAKKGGELRPEQYADFVETVNTAMRI
jgi:hypothetical protein